MCTYSVWQEVEFWLAIFGALQLIGWGWIAFYYLVAGFYTKKGAV